jgi:hypothetical protein
MNDDNPPLIGQLVSLRTVKEAHIAAVVAKTETLEEAAKILEIDIATLYRIRARGWFLNGPGEVEKARAMRRVNMKTSSPAIAD